MIEEIKAGGQLLAIIVSGRFREQGVHFFTPDDLSQQLAYMRHPAGKEIGAHLHLPAKREVHYTQEVLLIKKGKLRVDFYDNDKNYLESRVLEEGDIILLATGGHGFKVLEEVEMIEVKQGPFSPELDKSRFPSVNEDQIKLKP